MKKILTLILSIGIFMSCDEAKTEAPMAESDQIENPILAEWDTPFGMPPFDIIQSEDYLPAFKTAMELHDAELKAIIENTEPATFANTIVALETSGAALRKVSNLFFTVEAANTDDVLKETANEMAPLLSAHSDNMRLNADLFARVKAVKESEEAGQLTGEDLRLLNETYKMFVRSGAEVQGANKERLREINGRLATLSQQYGNNLLDETNSFELWLTDEKDVAELPANLVSVAKDEAISRGHESGWVFTLQRPSINPFLQSSTNRDYRKTMFDGYAMRGDNDNEKDNKAVLAEMAVLRVEKANLLGYKSHAHYVLEDNMAETPDAVYAFMDQLWKPALNVAQEEKATLAAAMKADGVTAPFERSDWRYYVEKVRAERYSFNEEETRPYFEFTAVREGVFMLANKLFGLTFKELTDAPKWHEDQQVFEVLEADGSHLGVIYMDFFARGSKRGGAWMNEIRAQSNVNGMVTPIVTNNFNFPPPSDAGPSLLSFSEAQTLFHEFGHGLHGLFSNVKYESMSGTNVPRDFVEFPSQVMENWMSEPEVLRLYAKHFQTGEVIPDELIKRMNDANQFNSGFGAVEYMAAAYLDMAWHTLTTTDTVDVRAFENTEMAKIELMDEIIPRYRSTYFSHIFSGGYSSGYYAYLWSEVLDADAFEAFKETSIFDQETAARYRTMLSLGGSKPGMDLYVDFRGKKPTIEPLMRKKGYKK